MNDKLYISDREKKALINYLSANFCEQDLAILNNWLSKDATNKLWLDQLSDIWQTSNYAHLQQKIDVQRAWEEMQVQLQQNHKKSVPRRNWVQVAAIALLALLTGVLGTYFVGKNAAKQKIAPMVEYVAPLGSRSFVKMPDGSKIWLNSGTTIKYQHSFGTDNRNICLSGEAFFEVAKNQRLPFRVNTGDICVTALGTKFNVKAYEEEKTIETTLLEGAVKLESDVVKLQENLVLKRNEKAVFTKEGRSMQVFGTATAPKQEKTAERSKPTLQIIEKIDPLPIVSWKEKRWIISNEKLGSLAVKLERRYDVNFIFDNEILKEYSFGGTLEDETLEQVLKAISFTAPIKYVIDGKMVYIMADGQKMEKFKKLLMK